MQTNRHRVPQAQSKALGRSNKSVISVANNGAAQKRINFGDAVMLAMRRSLLLGVALSLAVFAPSARAWWNDDWSFRKEIKFDLSAAGANITASPAEVPVLIRLSLANFEFFGDTKPDGADLRFVAGDDKTPLSYHIERYDPTAQIGLVWVRVPRLTSGAATDKIYMYYGNANAPPAANAAATYDKNQALLYQFGPPAGSPQDATAYKTEPSTFTAEVTPASLIGSGARFTGSNSIVIPATGAARYLPAQGWTLTAWVRIEVMQTRAYIANLSDTSGQIVLGIDGTKVFARAGSNDTPTEVVQSGDGLQLGTWHHLTLRINQNVLTLLVDGVDVATSPISVAELGGSLTVGSGSAGNNFVGDIDELAVSNIGRANEWIRALATSQGMVAPLVAYGGDAQREGGGEGYFATTLRNVTFDGWVVIAILAVIFFWSLWIMIAKAILLSKVQKGNAAFLAEFRKVRDDPAAIERRVGAKATEEEGDSAFDSGNESELVGALTASKETFGASTLFRLYHHGMRETLTRLEGKAAGADRTRTLSAAAIESIRATMDASLTRMTQRLNSQMVILTIAIAGGPFLGLLGTVIGVLIVFAAIAVTGDVNINAIAPGTAAALVATVAGLGVAIPCLFGYNWLNTRIKEIVADMRVFVDEFVTRIAESYT